VYAVNFIGDDPSMVVTRMIKDPHEETVSVVAK
jgi:hypothetical protein